MIPEKYGDARDLHHASQKEDRNFKNVVKDEGRKQKKKTKRGGKKKRKAKEAAEAAAGGDFSVDTKDSRFAAMYDDSSYAIDPTDPRFKSTNNMQKILQEKQARRKAAE